MVSFERWRDRGSMYTQRANEDRNEVEESFMEDLLSVGVCADVKTMMKTIAAPREGVWRWILKSITLLSTILIS